METNNPYSAVLKEYVEGKDSIAARMLNRGYLTRPAKTAGFAGKNDKIDQSLYVHIMNGVFGITRLLGYLARTSSYQLSEAEYRAVLAIFTCHDLHKNPDVERGGRGEFDIPLEAFREEGEALGLFDFANISVEQMRLGMMHLNKKMVGDFSSVPPNTSKLIRIVRLADTLASLQEPSQYRGLLTDLHELSPRLIGQYMFCHHELNEYRGLSTQLLHLIVSEILEKDYQCYPLLFFADGVMYIGPANAPTEALSEDVVKRISREFFARIQQKMQKVGDKVADEALNPQQTVKFEQYAYLFSNASQLLGSLASYAVRKAPKRFLSDLIERRIQTKSRSSFREKYPSVEHFCQYFGIDLEYENDSDLAAKWWAVSQFIKGLESIARDMLGDNEALSWVFEALQTPEIVRANITGDIGELKSGGVADYGLIIAYHYLRSQTYRQDSRSARAVELSDVLAQLQEQLLPQVEKIANVDARQVAVDRELALAQDLESYLAENFVCSHPAFVSFTGSPGNVFAEYEKRRTGASHQRLCVLCSRVIPAEMRSSNIKTGIIEDQALVFSNKLVPREKVSPLMVWCPMCYLEFTLRQLSGLGYIQGADSGLSDRLYLYLFPDYFFTPEQIANMKKILDMFREQTALKLRRYGKDDEPSLPTLWMRESCFNEKMQRDALASLVHEAKRLEQEELDSKKRPTGRKRRDRPGDRLRSSELEALNYALILYEKSTTKSQPELAPTRSELWCKAIYTALVAYLLLGVRVYVTDKPYLTVSKSTELQHIITLDAPHSLLRGLLNQSANEAFIRLTATKGGHIAVTVQEAMDAVSALWVVNEHLAGQSSEWWRRNLDKEVASLLSQINSNPLAGAAFYKERQRDDLPTTPEFTKACTYLLDLMGGWKLDLARTLARQSLEIFLPASKDRKGKANQYERLYRLALETLKKMTKVEDPGEMKARIAGAIEKAVVRQEDLNKGTHFTGKINCRDDELKDRAYAFAETVVDELFIRRCGRNISKLLAEENSLADGIYYVIDCELGKYWERRRESMKAAFGQNGQEDLLEDLTEVE